MHRHRLRYRRTERRTSYQICQTVAKRQRNRCRACGRRAPAGGRRVRAAGAHVARPAADCRPESAPQELRRTFGATMCFGRGTKGPGRRAPGPWPWPCALRRARSCGRSAERQAERLQGLLRLRLSFRLHRHADMQDLGHDDHAQGLHLDGHHVADDPEERHRRQQPVDEHRIHARHHPR